MKTARFALLAALVPLIAASALAQRGAVHFYANADADGSEKWNAASGGKRWTNDGGDKFKNASSKGVNHYHTNGYVVKAGRVAEGLPNPFTFGGTLLIVDGFSKNSKLSDSSNGAGGEVFFDLAGSPKGPRSAGASGATSGGYAGNIATAPTAGGNATPGDLRTVRTANGVTTLGGALTLNGNTNFTVAEGANDVLFNIKAPVSGVGSIAIGGGALGSAAENGWVTWSFESFKGWLGAKIAVADGHTLRFAGTADFSKSNPRAALELSAASPGFIDLASNATFGAGKVSFGDKVLEPGSYTADQLNALWGAKIASGTGKLTVRK